MKNIKVLVKWLETTNLFSMIRNYILRSLASYYNSKGKLLYIFSNSLDVNAVNQINRIKEETEILMSDQEAYLIYTTVAKLEKIPGDIAEVGVYKGGTAKLIRHKSKKPLHLFDTFKGLPKLSTKDNKKQFHEGEFSASMEEVKINLAKYSKVYLYKGLFPLTAKKIMNKKFSFVHLDVDLYKSTLDCLKYFYPRVSRGGVIISHDYPNSDGVKKAFDEFFQDKPEIIIEPFATGQCLIVKV